MTVTKESCDIYTVRANGEYASIVLREWDRLANVCTDHEGIYYCGEILINSSYGAWAHTWTACADPFRQFLLRCSFDYLFGKFMGSALDEFDGPASVREAFRTIARVRRHRETSKKAAREAWFVLDESSDEAECSEYDFGNVMFRIRDELPTGALRARFDDAMEWPRMSRPATAAVGFWEELWPSFCAALRVEIGDDATYQAGVAA